MFLHSERYSALRTIWATRGLLVIDLKISRRTVSRVFVSLVEKGYIERIGTNKKVIGK